MEETASYLPYMVGPIVLGFFYLVLIEKQNRRTADALERIAKSLEAKPLKLDEIVELDQRL